ncbi:MAG TPA: CoA-transferase [Burkholderiales bacterium]|jgi:glutaconate CoA-transferase subunit A|nr:CoA-transferase [Burkholderiales bacterium]
MNPIRSVQDIAAALRGAGKLAVPKDVSGPSLAVTRELIRGGASGLHLVCVPVGGLQADLLIGAGAVSVIETSAVTLGEYGAAPRFTEAVRNGSLRILDATCPAIYAGLQAAEKGVPFLPLRGLIGTDVLRHRSDWKVIDNPFEPGDAIVALRAIQPDAALFHVPLADRHGNVFVGTRRELMLMAHAARQTFVTAEQIVDHDLLEDPGIAAGVLPAIYVTAVALAPRGAAPLAFRDLYPEDHATMARYAAAAKTAAGFEDFLQAWLQAESVAA